MFELFTCTWAPGGIPAPLSWGEPSCCAHPGVSCTVRLQLLLSHISSGSAFGAVPACPRKGQLLAPESGVHCGVFPAAARHSLPMAGAGFGPRTGLSPCSTAQMRCSPHLEVLFAEFAACTKGAQLGVTCTHCFPGFSPWHCTPDSVRGNGLGFFASFSQRGGLQRWHSAHSTSSRSVMGHAGFFAGV